MKMIIDIDEKILRDMENGYIRTSELVKAVKKGKLLEKKEKGCCGNCKHYEPSMHYCVKRNITTFSNASFVCFRPIRAPSE